MSVCEREREREKIPDPPSFMHQNINLQSLDRRCQIAVIITRSFLTRVFRPVFCFSFYSMPFISVFSSCYGFNSTNLTGNPSTHTTWHGLLFQKNDLKKGWCLSWIYGRAKSCNQHNLNHQTSKTLRKSTFSFFLFNFFFWVFFHRSLLFFFNFLCQFDVYERL